jgi:hypothetical protein
MLTKPNHGWTNLQIGDFIERASYLTDIPNDCLDAFIYALRNSNPAVIFFDAEGWDFHLVASYYQSYIIVDKDDTKVYVFEKTIKELAKELYEDIKNNFDDWLNWDLYDTVEEKEENERGLKKKLSDLNMEIYN